MTDQNQSSPRDVRIDPFDRHWREFEVLPAGDSLRALLLEAVDVAVEESATLGDVVRAIHQRAEKSGEVNLQDANMNPASLKRIEKGTQGVTFDTIDKLGQAFGVHPMVICIQLMRLRWLEASFDENVSHAADSLITALENLPAKE